MGTIQSISGAIGALFYGIALLGVTGTLQIVQVSSFVIRPFSEELLMRINSRLVGMVWVALQYVFEARVTFSGDRLPDNESALVISNHRSWSDFYMLNAVAFRRRMLHNCKYFVKDSIKWLPLFGWGMWLAGFVFVRRNWLQDQSKIEDTFATIKRLKAPAWIINYVEGSRSTPAKLSKCQEYARERGYTLTEHVLLPRTRGFAACINAFRRSHIKFVYDFTIAYRHRLSGKAAVFNEAPSIIRIHSRSLESEYDFHVDVRRFAIEDLPADDDALGDWLRRRYVDKDKLLSKLKANWTDGIDGPVWDEPVF